MLHARGAWVPDFDVVLIDQALDRAGRRCTLAHELAHIDLGHGRAGHKRDEGAADQLAARRLMTVQQLMTVVGWTASPVEAALELDVTEHMLAVRLKHLHPSELHAL